jgi:hypothetical protein
LPAASIHDPPPVTRLGRKYVGRWDQDEQWVEQPGATQKTQFSTAPSRIVTIKIAVHNGGSARGYPALAGL